jgi:nicotinamidase-related amidase
MKAQKNKNPLWDASECALVIMDYQPEVLEFIHDKTREFIELNVSTLARMASRLNIPVILSTLFLKKGNNSPTLNDISSALPNALEIDRNSSNGWDEEAFVNAVRNTKKKKLIMCGVLTSGCLTYTALCAMAEGFEVAFVEDAVGDRSKEEHDMAVMRLIQAGAVPNTTLATMTEWFRNWSSPIAEHAREIFPGYLIEMSKMRGYPVASIVDKYGFDQSYEG